MGRIFEGILLYHWADRNTLHEARVYHSVKDARQIAKYDSSGAYRPLKGSPNLPRGRVIELPNIDDLKIALDYFIPGPSGPGWPIRPEPLFRSVYEKR